MTETGVRPELVPPELFERVVRFFDPELVILSGSRARGDAGADSDYDLLVVVPDHTPVEKRRLSAGHEARAGWSGSIDIIPCTQSGFERQREVIGTLAEIAVHEGIVVHAWQAEVCDHRRVRCSVNEDTKHNLALREPQQEEANNHGQNPTT